jgi:hypothetical protein
VYKVLVGKPEGKGPLGRSSKRREGLIRMDLTETGCWSVEWIQLAQDRDRWLALVNTVMNLRVLAPLIWLFTYLVSYFPEVGVGLVPKRGCLLTLAYYAFPR